MQDVSRDIVYEFLFAVFGVVVTVIVIILAKKFGKIKNGAWGPEFNLLTYGFLWETVMAAMRGEPYWQGFTCEEKFKPLLLGSIMVMNTILLAWAKGQSSALLKLGRGILGTSSLLIFLAIDTYWQ